MITELLKTEFDQEMQATRALLDRVPMDRADYLPHVKSMTAGRLATHIVMLAGWTPTILSKDELDLSTIDREAMMATAGSKESLLSAFDENVKSGLAAFANVSDADMQTPWTLRMGDHVVMTSPRYMVFRRIMLNHLIHHRGQLNVYLRMLDVPLPKLYGPSADEPM
jgi:uncharacterized damage-inducible protein DinB